ncbi:P-loop containing nucleoside triphosphate hydrolase protein, partial [Caulochytrium protostelioides]
RAIVEWIFHEINNRLGSREAVAIINVVDFLGFENATPKNNGLEAFATNMAHEVLMHALHVKAPRDRRAMLVEEGVPVPATMGDGDSNTPESDALSDALVDLLVQREGGICRLVEEYTHKPKTSPETLLEVLLDRNRDDPLLSAGPAGWSRFVLNHHGEPITYDVSDWMQTNRIDLDPAYIELFGLNAATKSKSAVAFLTK